MLARIRGKRMANPTDCRALQARGGAAAGRMTTLNPAARSAVASWSVIATASPSCNTPVLSRTTRLPAAAAATISSIDAVGAPHATGYLRASRRAKPSAAVGTLSSKIIRSALRSALTAPSVNVSASVADRDDRNERLDVLRLHRSVTHELFEVGIGRHSLCLAHRQIGETIPKPALVGGRNAKAVALTPPRLRRRGPARKTLRQQTFNERPDGLAKYGSASVRRDGDDQRRAVDDGTELKIAERGTINDVDRDARRTRLPKRTPTLRDRP